MVHSCPNNFGIGLKSPEDFILKSDSSLVSVINAMDGELITEKSIEKLELIQGILYPDLSNDILKISVINRYNEAPIASGFIKNFGIKKGALASTVAHDSHNIVVIGTNDDFMCKAANLLISNKGGLSAVNSDNSKVISLPIAGLMSDRSCEEIGKEYSEIDAFVKSMGSTLSTPFMTLSFMSLLVIPKIKISDKGLFDADKFEFINSID
jgi:adenine deaminase